MAVEIKEKPKVEEFQVVSIPEIKVSKGAEEVLRIAYEKLRKPRAWIKHAFHRDVTLSNGRIVYSHCALGAMGFDGYSDVKFTTGARKQAANLYARVAGVPDADSIARWNDDSQRRKKHVLAVFQELLK